MIIQQFFQFFGSCAIFSNAVKPPIWVTPDLPQAINSLAPDTAARAAKASPLEAAWSLWNEYSEYRSKTETNESKSSVRKQHTCFCVHSVAASMYAQI